IGVVVHQDRTQKLLLGFDIVGCFAIMLLRRGNSCNLSSGFVHHHPFCLFPAPELQFRTQKSRGYERSGGSLRLKQES
ncbi:hypothetical protein ACCS75_35570, partial [Rhizobium ruizarguesonis]